MGQELEFVWHTEGLSPGKYKVYVFVDSEGQVFELDENNNIASIDIFLYSYLPNFPIMSSTSLNASPVTFDLSEEDSGEEIIFGDIIYSSNGGIVGQYGQLGKCIGYSSISNLYNNDAFQILQYDDDPTSKVIRAWGEDGWTFNITGANTSVEHGPVIMDIDNNGTEEVIFFKKISSATPQWVLVSLDSDGQLRWELSPEEWDGLTGFFSPLVYNTPQQKGEIAVISGTGKIFIAHEDSQQNPVIDPGVQLLGINTVIASPKASDLDNNGDVEIIFLCKVGSFSGAIIVFDPSTLTYQTYSIQNLCDDFILSDVNNDGYEDIIVQHVLGLLVLTYENSTIYELNSILMPGIELSEMASGDFDNDEYNDIVCQVLEDGVYYIEIVNYSGEKIYEAPLLKRINKIWLSDIDYDRKNEIIYIGESLGQEAGSGLYAIGVTDAGNSIGWPGQQGNIRNSGITKHPAYHYDDTFYWYNTTSLFEDEGFIEVPSSTSLVIKPGTKIVASIDSQFEVYGSINANGSTTHPILINANISGASKDYWKGIVLCNNSSSSFAYATVSDAEFGLLYEDFTGQILEKCTFTNNTVGVGAFDSSPVLKECHFTDNDIGIGSYCGASPLITDLVYEQPFRNAVKNNTMDIYLCESSIYMNNGYNDIYNEPAEGQYIVIESEIYLDAASNYWGSTSFNEIMHHLPEAVDIVPFCTEPNTGYKSSNSIAGDLLKEAYQEMNEADYQAAEAGFKNLIANYPLSNQAYVAVSGLYACYLASGGNLSSLEMYFNDVYSDTLSLLDKDLVFGYLNLVKRAREDYQVAIANYESVIMNNPAYNDSVFAVINIGNTYIEAGLQKAGLGSLSYLRPQSEGAHIEKTIDLLLSLKIEQEQAKQPRSRIVVGQNRPNPFTDRTQIPIYLPYAADVVLHLYNVLGIKVSSINQGRLPEGKHSIELTAQSLGKGVYFYSVYVNDQFAGTGKMVVK